MSRPSDRCAQLADPILSNVSSTIITFEWMKVGTSAARAQSDPSVYPAAPPPAAQQPPPAAQQPPPAAQQPPAPYGAPVQPYGAPAPSYGYGAPYAPNANPYANPYAVNPQNYYLYEASKRSVGLAVVLELLVPGVGSLYADHVIGAVITWGVTIAGIMVALSANEQDAYGYTSNNDDQFALGVLLVLAGRIYGIVDSVQSTNEYNHNLAARLGLPPTVSIGVTPLRDGTITAWGPSMGFRF